MSLGWAVSSELGCLFDSLPNHTRALPRQTGHLRCLNSADLDNQIDTVEKGSRDPLSVSGQDRRSAFAGLTAIAIEATGTWIGGTNEMKRRGKLCGDPPTRHSHETILQGLAKCVEIAPWEFRQLVQEEDAPMPKYAQISHEDPSDGRLLDDVTAEI
jgi:hypothetical protein